jgi:hypothetical protein
MAKPLIAELDGSPLPFSVLRIDRAKLYGTRRRVALDPQGRPCTKAALLPDGEVLGAGMVAQGHFTPEGGWVPRQQMVGFAPDGSLVTPQPPTLGQPFPVDGPLDPSVLLDLALETVYWLQPESDGPLLERLRAGEVFRVPFAYTTDIASRSAYLVANDEGVFALVGQTAPAPWVEAGTLFVPAEDEADEDANDLDFEDL